jgi:hypothetical protein
MLSRIYTGALAKSVQECSKKKVSLFFLEYLRKLHKSLQACEVTYT